MATLTEIPSSITAGTTVEYTRTYTDYLPSAGWSLTVHLAGANVLTKIVTAVGETYPVVLSTADTAGLAAGRYLWEERAHGPAGQILTAASGTLMVQPNVASATAGSLQSFAERQLALLEAALERRYAGGGDMEAFSVGGRSVNLIPTKELEGMRNRARWAVSKERNGGRIPPRKITFPGV